MTTAEQADRQQRLDAILQLEQQHKQRQTEFGRDGQLNPLESQKGTYFILLISKGSGNLSQRANQDRVEIMLKHFPHYVLDGSNDSYANKRDELLEISQKRGNYPQLFIAHDGGKAVSYIGDFEMIEYYNDEGKLGSLLENFPSTTAGSTKSPSKLVKGIKKIVQKTAKTKKSKKQVVEGSSVDHSHSQRSEKSTKERPKIASTDTTEDEAEKPISTGKSKDDDVPLEDGTSKIKSRRKSRSNSVGKLSTTSIKTKSNSTSSRRKITRSSSAGKFKTKDEIEGKEKRPSRHRSNSQGPLRDSTHHSESSRKKSSRASSRGAITRDSGRGDENSASGHRRSRSRDARTRSQSKNEASLEGELTLNDQKSSKEAIAAVRKRSQSRSNRNLRTVDSLKEDNTNEKKESSKHVRTSRPRSKSQSKRSTRTIGSTLDDEESATKEKKPASGRSMMSKKGTRLKDRDGEKHPKSRRKARSSSPRREKVRSTSPGTFRGDIARKREAMKEFRERKSMRNIGGEASEKKITKHRSVGQLDVKGLRTKSSRRFQSIVSVNDEKDQKAQPTDESLKDLVKRVKDKERPSVSPTVMKKPSLPSVEW